MSNYTEFIKILDQWAKDFQNMPEGEEKIKTHDEMTKAINWFYGQIKIEIADNDLIDT
jgi:hypothetical protein